MKLNVYTLYFIDTYRIILIVIVIQYNSEYSHTVSVTVSIDSTITDYFLH